MKEFQQIPNDLPWDKDIVRTQLPIPGKDSETFPTFVRMFSSVELFF
jgi:hypothetical protein